jgi:predicted metal-dependent hydrolase
MEAGLEKTVIGETEYNIIRKDAFGRTASARVRGGDIIIRIPSSIGKQEKNRLFVELKDRIIRKIERNPDLIVEKSRKIMFEDGQNVSLLGRSFTINVSREERKHACARLMGYVVKVILPEGYDNNEDVSILARRAITKAILPLVEKRVADINAQHFNTRVNRIRIMEHESKWGSCSSKKNINFSFDLFFMPNEIIDSVIVHELAHTKEMNHSKEFWNIVYRIVPDYKEKKRWLERNGRRWVEMQIEGGRQKTLITYLHGHNFTTTSM